MDALLLSAVLAAIGFSWPVFLGFVGTVTPFQVYVGTAIAGFIYFVPMAIYGDMPVGRIYFWPTVIIFISGIMGAFGFAKYVTLLQQSPAHAGIALALTQILIVFGCTVLHHGGLAAVTFNKMIGLAFTSIGIYLMNVR